MRIAIAAVLGIGCMAASIGGFFFTRDVLPELPYTLVRGEDLRLLLRQNEILLDSGGRLRWSDPGVVFIAANSPGSGRPVRFDAHDDRICLYEVPGRREDWYCLWFSRHRDGTVHTRAGLSEQAWCRLARRPCEGAGQPAPSRPPWTGVTLRPIGSDAS